MPLRFRRLAALAPLFILPALFACVEDAGGPARVDSGPDSIDVPDTTGSVDTSDTAGTPDTSGIRAAVSLEILTGPRSAQVGDTVTLVAVLKDSVGDVVPGPVVWSSSDTTRVHVSASGVVTARRVALVTLTAASGALRDSVAFNTLLAPFAFSFPDTLSPATARLILDGVQDAQAFQREALGRAVTESTAITAAAAHPACASGGAAAATTARSVIFCLNNPGWAVHGPVIKQKIVQHELFHAWQSESGWLGGDPNASGAMWLIEGAAELMGFRGVAARGLIDMETARGCQVKESFDFATRMPPGLPALSAVESRQAFQTTQGPLYTHSMLAAERLTTGGAGLVALRAYGDSLAAGVSWQAAFQTAFGQTAAAFYAGFPAYLAGLAVPPQYMCRL